jgi:hypothetical protein
MEVKVKLHDVRVIDVETGKAYTIRTLRSAKEIAEFLLETEKEIVIDRLEEAVLEAY